MSLLRFLAAAVCVGLMATKAPAQPVEHVQAELLANVSAVQAGKPFWLGVRLKIDPGWHVYWKNPGDAGLPTKVKFTVPDGFTVGSLQYPTPRRLDQPGNILALAYENSVLLLAKVTPPDQLPTDFHGGFAAAVSWLVCSQVCLPGKTTVNLTLPSSGSAEPNNQELFDQWISQVPVGSDNSADVAQVSSHADNQGHIRIGIVWRHAAPDSIEFLPGALDDYNLENTQVESTHDQTAIRFTIQPLAGITPAATTMDAVVGYATKEGNRRGVKFSVALPTWSGNNQH